jgi:hypothetical protein
MDKEVTPMQVTGKCHCGRISFRAKVDAEKVMLCHCVDCQIITGCAYRVSARVAVGDYELLSGTPKIYVKIGDSGAKRAQGFCGDCGTQLYAENLENPTVRAIRVGSIDQRASLIPTQQIWCRSALAWADNISEIKPKLQKQPA